MLALRQLPVPQAKCNWSTSMYDVQLRDFLHKSLADPATGYFANDCKPVGAFSEPIAFSLLLGESGWRARQAALYRQLQVCSAQFIPCSWLMTKTS